MRTSHRIAATVISGLLLLGVAACGNDDDTPATTGTTLEPIGDGDTAPASEEEGETAGSGTDSGSTGSGGSAGG